MVVVGAMEVVLACLCDGGEGQQGLERAPVWGGRARCEPAIVPELGMVENAGAECGGSLGFGWTQFHHLGWEPPTVNLEKVPNWVWMEV